MRAAAEPLDEVSTKHGLADPEKTMWASGRIRKAVVRS